MSESEAEVVELPGMPRPLEGSAFEIAHTQVVEALGATRERLVELRRLRADTNAEIKVLVDEEEWLMRMSKVRKRGET